MIVSMIASLTAILIVVVVVVVMTTTLMAGIDVVRSQLGPVVRCNPHWRRSTTYRMSGNTSRNESFTSILWWWYAFCHPTTCIRATVTTNTYSTTTTIQTTIISDQSGIRMSEENVFSLKVFVHTVIACFDSYPIHRQNYLVLVFTYFIYWFLWWSFDLWWWWYQPRPSSKNSLASSWLVDDGGNDSLFDRSHLWRPITFIPATHRSPNGTFESPGEVTVYSALGVMLSAIDNNEKRTNQFCS